MRLVSPALERPALLGLGLLGLVILVFPFLHTWPIFESYIGPFRTFQATMLGVWLLVTLGMNLLTGYSGQISLGHAALVTVGAYATAILFDQYNLPLAAAVLVGGLFTFGIGFLLGFPSVRLSGPYLAIATLATVVALPQILKLDSLSRWTNGALGVRIDEPQPPGLFDRFLDQGQWTYYAVVLSAVAMTVLAWNLVRSRIGRAFVALRDSEVGAVHMGVNLPLYKALAFGISAFYAGLGGGFLFMVQAFISPDSVDLFTSLKFLVAIVIGGLASILGSVLGAVFLTTENDIIALASRFIPDATNLRWAIFGGLLIMVVVVFPRGFAGFLVELARWRPGRGSLLGPGAGRWLGYLDAGRGALRRFFSGAGGRGPGPGPRDDG